jgi:hypothetical protein
MTRFAKIHSLACWYRFGQGLSIREAVKAAAAFHDGVRYV